MKVQRWRREGRCGCGLPCNACGHLTDIAYSEDEEAALARDASRALAQTLAQDPTFKDSSLAEFMTKLADGAVEIQDNSVVPGASPQISIVGETTGAGTTTAGGAGATGRMQAAWDSAHGGDEVRRS